ncbi:MAG: hypothetical protein RL595_772 [Planctomycetota bacterium]
MRTCILLLSILFLMGCAGDDFNRGGALSGKVFLEETPLEGGTITLETTNGKHNASCEITPEGTYVISEPPLGECVLSVKTSHLKGAVSNPTITKTKQNPSGIIGSPGMMMPKGVGLVYKPIPEKYENIKTSGITISISRGKQDFDIKLNTN